MKFLPLVFLFFFGFAGPVVRAQSIPTGPRKEQAKPVRLLPVPLSATPAEIQSLLDRHQNVYFGPGTYNIGTLRITNRQSALIWGAGRLTTQLTGSIRINGSRNITIGNFSLINNSTPKGSAVIDVDGRKQNKITLLNLLVSGAKDGTAIRLGAQGEYMIQGCNPKGSDIGIHITHPKAMVNVFGGNLQYNRVHIQQVQGHLDARAFGMQGVRGDADILIRSPSPAGFHLVEGLRSEGSNGTNPEEVLLQVPLTKDAVNVVLRANALGSMVHYADYNANGKLVLLENVNYPGEDDKSSVGVKTASTGKAVVLSYGNKYALSYDAAPGPFVVSPTTKVTSIGDLWMLPNKTDYKKSFNEPITGAALEKAGKSWPQNISFPTTAEAAREGLPQFPLYKAVSLPRIANLGALMLNVKEFGAIPDDGKDDRAALQQALDAAEKGGIYAPLYFPAGRYELAEPLFLDHLSGGGFWGDGEALSILVSTSGKGLITSDGAGYSVFADLAFVNRPGAETKTVALDWVNDLSPDKKRGRTGAALQANMFYRCRFENGGTGLAVGQTRMGDGFMIVDCIFRNNRNAKGEGAAYASENFNVLTNPLVHCLFENVDCAVDNQKGSFNFYGNRLKNVHTAALKFYTIVGNGFALVNNDMDASPVPFITTGHSSAKAHLLLDRVRVQAPPKQAPGSFYILGGSVMFLDSSFPNRSLVNGGGIGDNSLIVFKTVAAAVSASGRGHLYAGPVPQTKK